MEYNLHFNSSENEIERLNEESSQSLRTSLKVAYQSIDTGTEIMSELDKQSNQISKVERDVEFIEENNKKAAYHIRSLKSVFGTMLNKVLGYQYINVVEHSDDKSVASDGTTLPYQTSISELTSQEKDLDELHNALNHMCNMGMAMNTELDSQNQRLSKLSVNVDDQNEFIQKNNADIKELLYKN
jgi:vacuolar-type H+-ATPase subunit I/STV1